MEKREVNHKIGVEECKEDSYERETDGMEVWMKKNECDVCAINETGFNGNEYVEVRLVG